MFKRVPNCRVDGFARERRWYRQQHERVERQVIERLHVLREFTLAMLFSSDARSRDRSRSRRRFPTLAAVAASLDLCR